MDVPTPEGPNPVDLEENRPRQDEGSTTYGLSHRKELDGREISWSDCVSRGRIRDEARDEGADRTLAVETETLETAGGGEKVLGSRDTPQGTVPRQTATSARGRPTSGATDSCQGPLPLLPVPRGKDYPTTEVTSVSTPK